DRLHGRGGGFGSKGKSYPAGSFVVFTNQGFRPHVMDMFELQEHPNVIPYPGAPPTPPYDNAGWTLAFQMGVEFDRVLDGFSGPFGKVTDWNVKPPAGTMPTAGATVDARNREVNDSVIAVNRLLRQGEIVTEGNLIAAGGHVVPEFLITSGQQTASRLSAIAKDLGLSVTGEAPRQMMRPGQTGRGARSDQGGGAIESGWTRWILEQFEFPFARVYA